MKRSFIFIILFCLIVGLFSGCGKENASVETTPLLNSFTAKDLEGNIVDQQILSGHKLTMVNVWATFCSPCIAEMPDLGQLNTAFGDDFQIIGIVIDGTDRNLQAIPEEIAEAKEIIGTTGANYLHILPSASLNKAFLAGVSSVPTTVFVDENGNQIGPAYIGSKSKAQWQKIIEDLLMRL